MCLGTMMQLGHPGIAEILSNAGYSWLAVDMEHSDIDMEAFTNLCRAMSGRDTLPLARVRENDRLAIRQVLDMGAGGIIVPMVGSADEARKAVAAAKYPPRGVRGVSFHRANGYGAGFSEHIRNSDADVLVIMMIETRSGVEDIDGILAVEGVDGIFIGPYDLSGSYGVVGQLDHPLVLDAVTRCVGACRSAGKAAGIHIAHPDPELIRTRIGDGFTFIGMGYDSLFLDSAARSALAIASDVMGEGI